MKPYDQALNDQKERAIQLAKDRRCSHCGEAIALLEALCMVRGHGYRYSVKIALSDGGTVLVDEADFNPQTMLWGNKNERVGLDGGDQREAPESGRGRNTLFNLPHDERGGVNVSRDRQVRPLTIKTPRAPRMSPTPVGKVVLFTSRTQGADRLGAR